jgi:hypothetical protein
MKSTFVGSALLLTVAAATLGCRDAGSSTRVPEGTPEIVVRGEDAMRVRFGGDIQRLLLAGQYDSLEAMAESLRKREARWPNGAWKLRTFYNYGFDISVIRENASEADWQPHLRQLRQWNSSMPSSITAPVALAFALSSYAWEARGSQYAREVTEEGWRGMRERLAEARRVLVSARERPRVCPEWWLVAQKIALGEGWDRKFYEQMFSEATRNEPSFEGYYELKAIHLLPRWHGRHGEWEAFADTVANRLPSPLGDQMYARIVWSTHEYMGDNVFEESQVSWDRTRKGLEELVKAYPASLELRSIFAYLAWKAADQPVARQQFIEMGPRIDLGVWEDRPEFMEARKWAFE